MKKEMEKEKKVVDRESVLEFVGTVSIPATSEEFVVQQNFTVQDGYCDRISLTGWFKDWFFSKTEEPIVQKTLCYYDIRKSANDNRIIAELGEDKAEISLTEIYLLIERQKSRENGPLLTDGHKNVFYVRDSHGVLRSVLVWWSSYPSEHWWWVCGCSLIADDSGVEWVEANRIFSHN